MLSFINARFLLGVSLVCAGIGLLYYNDEDSYWVFYTFVTFSGLATLVAIAMYMSKSPFSGAPSPTQYMQRLKKSSAVLTEHDMEEEKAEKDE